MGLREKINENPGVVTAITIGLVVVLLLFMAWNFFGGDNVAEPGDVWYLTSDNQWTAGSEADFDELGPDGQPRVRVHVFETADGQEVVGWYERMHPDALAQLQQLKNSGAPAGMSSVQLRTNGRQVRTPDNEEWVFAMTNDGQLIQRAPTGPDGARLQRVNP
ncbi:MAG: hypothetical protein AAGK78_04905 [Planctomycetota bacterium]